MWEDTKFLSAPTEMIHWLAGWVADQQAERLSENGETGEERREIRGITW